MSRKPPFVEIAKEGFELIFQATPDDNGPTKKILKALYSSIYEDKEPSSLSLVESIVYKSVYDAAKRRLDAWLRKTSKFGEDNPRKTNVEPQITVDNG